jgi:uncharacterized protein with GYD domain
MGYNAAMPTYIMLSTLTPEGVQTIKNNPQRIREVNKEIEQLGAVVKAQWATLGEFDFVNIVYRDSRQRLVATGPARAELERDARDRLLVRRLDHVHEVEATERRPLRLDGRPELLDLVVDLADSRGVVPDGLHALRRERREHDPGRHCPSLKWLRGPFYPILPPLRGVVGPKWILHA